MSRAASFVEVKLTAEAIAHATQLAVCRQKESERQGLKGKYGGPAGGVLALQYHQIGARGEIAVATFFNWAWPTTVNTFSAPDLLDYIQVRTRSKHHYDLIIRSSDANDEIFIHATSEHDDTVRIHGWIHGLSAKNSKWWANHGGREPAYFVPRTQLNSIESLRD